VKRRGFFFPGETDPASRWLEAIWAKTVKKPAYTGGNAVLRQLNPISSLLKAFSWQLNAINWRRQTFSTLLNAFSCLLNRFSRLPKAISWLLKTIITLLNPFIWLLKTFSTMLNAISTLLNLFSTLLKTIIWLLNAFSNASRWLKSRKNREKRRFLMKTGETGVQVAIFEHLRSSGFGLGWKSKPHWGGMAGVDYGRCRSDGAGKRVGGDSTKISHLRC